MTDTSFSVYVTYRTSRKFRNFMVGYGADLSLNMLGFTAFVFVKIILICLMLNDVPYLKIIFPVGLIVFLFDITDERIFR